MRENGDIFDNPPKNKSSNFPENSNSSCTTNLIKCTENFFSLSKDSKEPGSTCTQCNITFSDFQSKVNHTCMPYKCKICNTAFSFDFKLKMHKCNKRNIDKTENIKISTTNSPNSIPAELPDNENVSKKISKICCRCGKKLSPRCHGIFCRNCKSTADKNEKSTLMSTPSSLSELSSSEGITNSSETQGQIEACNQSTNILGEIDDIAASSDISDKICCRCGKKLSPRCHGIFCRNCKSTAHKNEKSTLMCKRFSKSTSSLSELSSSEGNTNSSETQDQIEACNQSTNIGEIDDIATSSDSHTSLPMKLHQKKIRLSMSEKIPKKCDSNKEKGKYKVALKKYSNDSSTSDKHDILSLSSQPKKKRGVDTESKGRRKTVSEVDKACSISASKSSTSTPSSNNEIYDSSKLTADGQDNLVGESSNSHGCKNLKICLTPVLSENSLESNKDSASESNSAKCNKLDNGPVEINDITLSSGISNDHEFESLTDEVGSFNISSKLKNPVNSESGPNLIESKFSECLMSGDNNGNNVPETSDKQKNSSSTGMNSFCKTRKVSIKKSKNSLSRLLSLKGNILDTDNPRKHLECDNFQIAGESNVLIASLKSKGKASKRKFSSDTSYFKRRFYKGSIMKCRHKFSRKLSSITEESVASLPSFQRNTKKVSFADFENFVSSNDSKCNEASMETSLKDISEKGKKQTSEKGKKQTSEKGKKQIFPFKGTSREALLTENSRTVSANTYSTTGNKKQKTDHSDPNSLKGRYTTDKMNEKNMRLLNSHKSSAYSVSDNPQHKRENEECKEKEDNGSESISFGTLIKALPENGIALIKGSVNGSTIFTCPKCNYVFKHVQRAADHARTCPCPKHKEKEPKLLSDFEYVCSLCYRHWSSVNGLYKHYKKDLCPVSNLAGKQRRRMANSSLKNTAISEKQSSCVSISNYICDYAKKHICLRCNFSCLSLYTFNQHQCERRLELMTKCIVEVKKLTKIDLAPFPNVTNFECPFCQEIFYDQMVYQNHCKKHKNVGRNSEKSSVHTFKEYENQIKKIFLGSRNCNTVDEITKRVIEPLSMIFSKIDNKNFNLNVNVSLPDKQQKLMSEAARNILSDSVKDMPIKKVFKFLAAGEDSSSVDDSDSRDSVSSVDTTSSFDFGCKCKKDIDPNIETKPCIKCLSQNLRDKLKEICGSTTSENEDNDVAALNSSVEAIPSTSNSNSSTLASGFSITAPNSFNASDVLHLNEVPINNDNSPVPSTSAVDKSSIIQISDLGQLTSNSDISLENAIITELEDQYSHLEQSLSCLKVLCFLCDTIPNVNEETFPGTKLPPKIKAALINHYSPVTIYKGIPEVLKDIRLSSPKSNTIVLFVEILPRSMENETTNATSASDSKNKMLAFLENLLDVADRTLLTSPLILDSETLDSIHNQHLKDSFPNLVLAKTCGQNNIQLKQLQDVRNLAHWDLDIVMDTLIFKENDFTVKFVVLPYNVTIIVDWVFDEKIEYDVYISIAPKQYICAACVEVMPLLVLIEHLTEVHKNTVITMCIL